MPMFIRLILSLLLLLTLSGDGFCHGDHADEVAKADLQALFPQADSFVARKIAWTDQLRSKVEKILGKKLHDHDLGMPVYVAVQNGRSLGSAWGGEADLKGGSVQVVVAVDMAGMIVGVRLPGSQLPVAQLAFLNQFKGRPADAKLLLGKDLKAAGDPAISTEVVRAVREAGVVVLQGRTVR